MSATYTKNFKLPMPDFEYSTWHDYYYAAMQIVDAAMAQYIQAFEVDGIWTNVTAYVVGDVVVDPDAGTLWKCLVNHTSDAAGSFEADRTANPTYWSSFGFRPVYRGTWTTGTDYNLGEFVVDPSSYIYAICNTTHTAGATFAGDSADWDYLIDISSFGANVDTLAAISANITTVAGISTDVVDVAAMAGDVTVVAGISTDIGTLADIEDGTVTTDAISGLAAIASDVTAVAGITADVTAVAANNTNITTVATNIVDVGTVATNIADINAVAADIALLVVKANDDLSNVTPAVGLSALGAAADDLSNVDPATGRAALGLDPLVVPAGSIIWHAANTAPTGYLKANGAAVSRTTYADLFAVIGTTFGAGDGSTTFDLPDLRGEFVRGWDDSRGVDSGRVFGSSQLDQMQRITGSINGAVNRTLFQTPLGAISGGTTESLSYNSSGAAIAGFRGFSFNSANSPDARVSATTAGETRSRNVALLACIKY